MTTVVPTTTATTATTTIAHEDKGQKPPRPQFQLIKQMAMPHRQAHDKMQSDLVASIECKDEESSSLESFSHYQHKDLIINHSSPISIMSPLYHASEFAPIENNLYSTSLPSDPNRQVAMTLDPIQLPDAMHVSISCDELNSLAKCELPREGSHSQSYPSSPLATILDSSPTTSTMPHVKCVKTSGAGVRFISPETTINLIHASKDKDKPFKLFIMDCRFQFEYEGGHIQNAQHCPFPNSLDELVPFCLGSDQTEGHNIMIIFYCEFSSERAPRMYELLRRKDRKYNQDCYPQLSYPNIYVVEGGYRAFVAQYPSMCSPIAGFVPMNCGGFKLEMIRSLKQLRNERTQQREAKRENHCDDSLFSI
eukprot:CAMPEP_0184693546 /NCGR_PEP_ID=MMETSP0313-20130426/1731_1 /TAXON_ID=2792 /ORGANISM="Porphyridium aerugineum, Strain SAG 1380-2" /LENGTH=364 /DNA_ID=CAMNT_0027151641 /DNA_START=638 /DNA_END=1732 /DNA_ORIENTATION=+